MIPTLTGIDHVHVYVPSREAAAEWFRQMLDFRVVESLRVWADEHGPLTIEDRSGTVHLALFRKQERVPSSAPAFGATAAEFVAWKSWLEKQEILDRCTDHDLSWSLYFSDPWKNSYEITSNEYDTVTQLLRDGGKDRIIPD